MKTYCDNKFFDTEWFHVLVRLFTNGNQVFEIERDKFTVVAVEQFSTFVTPLLGIKSICLARRSFRFMPPL